MFIQTEDTPNPHTLKFLPGQEIAPDEPRDFPTPEHADTSLLARELFETPIDAATRIQYRLVGPWDDPQFIPQDIDTPSEERSP